MERIYHKVNEELCAGCRYRAREGAFQIYHCDYALIKRKCRLDPPGTCSHYERDENYDPAEAARRAEAAKKSRRIYREAHKPKASKPRGRPKVRG